MSRIRARLEWSRDEGVGMILVIGTSVLVFALVVAGTAFAINGLSQSRQRTSFEQSLSVAENGIDQAMSVLQKTYDASATDYPIPGTSGGLGCTMADTSDYQFPAVLSGVTVSSATGVFIDAGGRTAEQNEREWARTKLLALKATGCTKSAPTGEYVILKPASPSGSGGKYGKIYSLSGVPSFGAAGARTRLLKSEYIFMPYRPSHAILTNGDLEFQGNYVVDNASGTPAGVSSVHTNGSLDITGNAGYVDGSVTASGSLSGNVGHPSGVSVTGGAPRVNVPTISARAFYAQAASTPGATAAWFDLCDDGTVRPYSSSGPCQSATVLGSDSYNNWTWTSGGKTWTAGTNIPAGTYFAYQSNVKNGNGNGAEPQITVLAAAKNPDNCNSKQYGNIDWDHYDLVAPAYPNLWFLADGDVKVTSNIKIGDSSVPVSGAIAAGDQVYLWTQSNSAVGSVVASDRCTSTQPGDSLVDTNMLHSDLYFDQNADLPFSSVITNTLWLDYSG